MKRYLVLFAIAALTISAAPCQTSGAAPAQTPPTSNAKPDQKEDLVSLIEFVQSVAKVVKGHHMDADTVKQVAAKLGQKYQKRLKRVESQAHALMFIGKEKLDAMGFDEKLTLAEQLWEVRSSINLMALLTPDMLFQLTGMRVPDLKELTDKFTAQEHTLSKVLPHF